MVRHLLVVYGLKCSWIISGVTFWPHQAAEAEGQHEEDDEADNGDQNNPSNIHDDTATTTDSTLHIEHLPIVQPFISK